MNLEEPCPRCLGTGRKTGEGPEWEDRCTCCVRGKVPSAEGLKLLRFIRDNFDFDGLLSDLRIKREV